MSTTVTHLLQIASGALRLTITETADCVYLSISGAHPKAYERPRLVRFFKPILDQYADDPRRLEVSGERTNLSARIDSCESGSWIAYQNENKVSA